MSKQLLSLLALKRTSSGERYRKFNIKNTQMTLNKKYLSALMAAAVCVMLTACGGAPSESDIKAAIDKQVKADMQAMQRAGGGQAAAMFKNMMPEIKDVKKIGCKEDGEKAYRCDIELQVSQGGDTSKGPASMRFLKGTDGWMAQK